MASSSAGSSVTIAAVVSDAVPRSNARRPTTISYQHTAQGKNVASRIDIFA